MKKLTLLLLIFAFALAACSGQADTTSNPDNTALDPGARELPLATKLAIGTFKLEGTELAVAPDQAADLLPLWQVLNNLSGSDSAAPEEVTAVTEQIQETMTAEQLKAIDDMNLTGQDIFTTMQELGLVNAPQLNASGTPEPGRNFQGGLPEGGMPPGGGPQGGPPDGGPGGGFSGQGLSQEQIATAQARRAEGGGGFGNRMMTPLVGAVIKLLESKAGS